MLFSCSRGAMARPVTLFTGQWADLDFKTMCAKAKDFGYDGLELACWGDHFDVTRALQEEDYCRGRWDLLNQHGLKCLAISNHLVGQATCDNIDSRHQAILPEHVWGDGDPEGVRQRAAEEMKNTARAAARLGVRVVNGFTGSSIWHLLYSFPPTDPKFIDQGYKDFAERWLPILDTFQEAGIRFGLEVHPTEIAFDISSSKRALEALNAHPAFGFNYDPSHLGYQGVDYVGFIRLFGDRIFHVHMKDVYWSPEPWPRRRFRRTSALRPSRPLLGFPFSRPGWDPLRRDNPGSQRDWIRGPTLGGMGRCGNGSRTRSNGISGL